jgi:two-component sensor histidine kinase
MAADTPIPSPIANKLALAMIAVSTAPLVLLDGDLKVVAASASFYRVFAIDPASADGREFFRLGDGEWNLPQLRALLKAILSGNAEVDAYEVDLKRAGQADRRLVLNAQRLDYGDAGDVSLLLTASDVTDARLAEKLKDDMLREKAVLLQEVQHRVANSLQIIASVLLQSARKVQSEETRTHLHDAHHRVMSIATVQQQLAASRLGDVELRPYFTQLCDSLGASMIHDHDQQSIVVSGDRSNVAADVSVSLGLIVTELVINALKHAFPAGRGGKIKVDYHSRGPNWTLSVADDGVGMPEDPAHAKPGLGTSIVEALARQLHARVQVAEAKPGTAVSIVHTQIAVVGDEMTEAAV